MEHEEEETVIQPHELRQGIEVEEDDSPEATQKENHPTPNRLSGRREP